MAPQQDALAMIKADLEACVGKRVRLRANRGRKKIIEAEGILVETYPKVFVVKLDKHNAVNRVSYTYADVLTETVELMVGDTRIGLVETA